MSNLKSTRTSFDLPSHSNPSNLHELTVGQHSINIYTRHHPVNLKCAWNIGHFKRIMNNVNVVNAHLPHYLKGSSAFFARIELVRILAICWSHHSARKETDLGLFALTASFAWHTAHRPRQLSWLIFTTPESFLLAAQS